MTCQHTAFSRNLSHMKPLQQNPPSLPGQTDKLANGIAIGKRGCPSDTNGTSARFLIICPTNDPSDQQITAVSGSGLATGPGARMDQAFPATHLI